MLQKATLFAILFLFAIAGKAQEQLKHPIKFHTNSEGRLFVNKNMPLYLWLSSSPDPNSKKQRLLSESSPQYSNPFYMDTEGYNTIRTPSQVDTVTKKPILPKQDIIFEIYPDSNSPKIKQNYGEAILYKKDGKVYCGKNTIINLEAEDELSGVDALYQSVDRAAYTKYNAPIVCNKEKDYVFNYYGVDNVGNVNEPKTLEFSVDISAPVTVSEVVGANHNNILNSSSKIKLTATDNSTGVKTVYYKIDNGPIHIYRQEISMSGIREGDHTIVFHAIDHVKNTESEKQYQFFLDVSAPMVIKEVLGDQYVVNGRVVWSGRTKLQLTAVDNKAGVKEVMYSISGGEYQKYDKPFYFPKKKGLHSIKYYALDNVDNKSTGDNSKGNQNNNNVIIDLTGPSLKNSYIGQTFVIQDTIYCNTKTKVKLTAKDAIVGIKQIDYSIDNGSNIVYTESFTTEKEGLHTIQYTGTDNVNNTNTASFFFIVDNTGPEIFERYSIVPIGNKTIEDNNLEVYPKHLVLFLSATDKLVGVDRIYYSINGAAEKLYSGLISDFRPNTTYTIKIRSVDKLGNSDTKTITFYIE